MKSIKEICKEKLILPEPKVRKQLCKPAKAINPKTLYNRKREKPYFKKEIENARDNLAFLI